jgi:glycosyltransferase involved in cell wall biosynthesis
MPETVAVVPLYNHARTVESVLDGIAACGLATIVVDDGSEDGGAATAEAWLVRTGHPGRVVRLERNRGKAAALAAGFDAAAGLGARRALTVDADGQHDAARIPALLAAAEGFGPAPCLVLGDRRPLPADYPLGRLAGRTLSGLAVRAACGACIGDAACGMRVYPVAETRTLPCLSGRYAWEEEAIVRLAWRGVAIRSVPIPVIYRDASVAPSHYRFRRDWTEGVLILLFTVLIRVIDPGARWTVKGASRGEMLWPLGPGDAGTSLLAISAAGTGATLTALAFLALDGGTAVLLATVPLSIAVSRTRAPVLPAAAGALLGWMAPPVAVLLAIPATVAGLVFRVARMRGKA